MKRTFNLLKKISVFAISAMLVFSGCTGTTGKTSGGTDNGGTTGGQEQIVEPAKPANFKAVAGNKKVKLYWENPKAASFEKIKIFAGTQNEKAALSEIAEITDKTTSYSVTKLANNAEIENGTTYYFAISAYFTDNETSFDTDVISATPKDLSLMSSVEFAQQLVIGWNLGNTLDANNSSSNNSGLSAETSWGMPYTTEKMIKAVADAGFKTIRIPVSWHNHLTETTNYTIDSGWMNRVKTIVDWAIAEDMYVILNVHHDNQEADKLASGAGLYGFALSTTDTSVQTKSKKYLEKVWTQIATTFNDDYDEKLIFEVLNEPREIGTANEWGIYNIDAAKPYCNVITDYENTCISAIRATGGNNTKRFLMVPGYAASGTSDVMLDAYTLPNDSATDKLLLSTHAYSPYYFAMANSDSTFGSDDESSLTSIFNYLKTNYTDKGIGVVMGEASASNKDNTAEHIKWANAYFAKAQDAGIPVVLWDNMVADPDGNENVEGGYNGEHHGWLNRPTCEWYFPTIIEAMMKTVGVSGYSIPEYVIPTASNIGWDESKATTVSNESKALNWNSEYTPGDSYFTGAKAGSILKVTFAASGATLRLTNNDWKINYNTGTIVNGSASGDAISVSSTEVYYVLTASDATAWSSKGLTISGDNGTVTSVKFLANPSTN